MRSICVTAVVIALLICALLADKWGLGIRGWSEASWIAFIYAGFHFWKKH